VIQYSPPAGVIERWQPELDRIAPPTARGLSSLRLVWEPGEPWAPVGRWIIYECVPAERAPMGIFEELRGPNPRSFGRWDPVARVFRRERMFVISRRQWLLYRETGLYGRPLWVVQGSHGGHKREWSEVEQTVIGMMTGQPEAIDPPAPGDLPYAEPDERTIVALRGLDLSEKFGSLLHLVSQDEQLRASLDSRERATAKAMAEQLWGWLRTQVAESLTLTRAMVNDIWDNANPNGRATDYDAEQEDFINEVAGAATH